MKRISKPSKMHVFFSLLVLILVIATISACTGRNEPGAHDLAATYAAQTLQAFQVQQTLSAYEHQATQAAIATPTPEPIRPRRLPSPRMNRSRRTVTRQIS